MENQVGVPSAPCVWWFSVYFGLDCSSEPSGIRIELVASKTRYDINLATSLVTSTRRNFLGHAGVATIKSPDGVINVGSSDGYSLLSSQLKIDLMATTIVVILMVVFNLCVIGAIRNSVSTCKNGRRKLFHLASTMSSSLWYCGNWYG